MPRKKQTGRKGKELSAWLKKRLVERPPLAAGLRGDLGSPSRPAAAFGYLSGVNGGARHFAESIRDGSHMPFTTLSSVLGGADTGTAPTQSAPQKVELVLAGPHQDSTQHTYEARRSAAGETQSPTPSHRLADVMRAVTERRSVAGTPVPQKTNRGPDLLPAPAEQTPRRIAQDSGRPSLGNARRPKVAGEITEAPATTAAGGAPDSGRPAAPDRVSTHINQQPPDAKPEEPSVAPITGARPIPSPSPANTRLQVGPGTIQPPDAIQRTSSHVGTPPPNTVVDAKPTGSAKFEKETRLVAAVGGERSVKRAGKPNAAATRIPKQEATGRRQEGEAGSERRQTGKKESRGFHPLAPRQVGAGLQPVQRQKTGSRGQDSELSTQHSGPQRKEKDARALPPRQVGANLAPDTDAHFPSSSIGGVQARSEQSVDFPASGQSGLQSEETRQDAGWSHAPAGRSVAVGPQPVRRQEAGEERNAEPLIEEAVVSRREAPRSVGTGPQPMLRQEAGAWRDGKEERRGIREYGAGQSAVEAGGVLPSPSIAEVRARHGETSSPTLSVVKGRGSVRDAGAAHPSRQVGLPPTPADMPAHEARHAGAQHAAPLPETPVEPPLLVTAATYSPRQVGAPRVKGSLSDTIISRSVDTAAHKPAQYAAIGLTPFGTTVGRRTYTDSGVAALLGASPPRAVALEMVVAAPSRARQVPGVSPVDRVFRNDSGSAPAAGGMVQRAPMSPATSTGGASGAAPSSVSSQPTATTPPAQPAPPSAEATVDLKALAREVYPLLRRMVIVEKERLPF